MTIQQNFLGSRPSLSLNFATSRKLDPRVTFTRTTSGTRINEEGYIELVSANRPRFDHDPATLEPRGLLIEESRINYYTTTGSGGGYSPINGFAVDTVNAVSRTTDTNVLAPDGQPALLYRALSGTNFHGFGGGQVTGIGATTNVTLSCWVKDYNNSDYRLYFVLDAFNPTTSNSNYLLAPARPLNATFTSVGFGNRWTNVTSRIENYGSGWYRFSVTGTYNFEAGRTVIGYGFQLLDNTSAQFYTPSPSGVYGLYAYGPQLEFGLFPTSYIPVPASATSATRGEETAFVTGSKFSKWYNPNEGTLFARATSFARPDVLTGVAALNVPTDGNKRVDLRYNQGGNSYVAFNSSPTGPGLVIARTSGYSLTNPKFAVGYKTNIQKFAANGSLQSATSTFTPAQDISHLQIGTFDNFQYRLNGYISQLNYYPVLLSDAQITRLTQ